MGYVVTPAGVDRDMPQSEDVYIRSYNKICYWLSTIWPIVDMHIMSIKGIVYKWLRTYKDLSIHVGIMKTNTATLHF